MSEFTKIPVLDRHSTRMKTPCAAISSTAFLVSVMSQRYRKTRPIVLLMAGWFLLGLILVANTLVHANTRAGERDAAQECGSSSAIPR
jgi:hypothetical protein